MTCEVRIPLTQGIGKLLLLLTLTSPTPRPLSVLGEHGVVAVGRSVNVRIVQGVMSFLCCEVEYDCCLVVIGGFLVVVFLSCVSQRSRKCEKFGCVALL